MLQVSDTEAKVPRKQRFDLELEVPREMLNSLPES